MTNFARYQIVVKKDRKVIDCRYYSSYDAAMIDLDFIEDNVDKFYAIGASVEFKDNNPFGR